MLFNRINIFFVLISLFMFIFAAVCAYFSITDSIEDFMFFSLFWVLLGIGFLWLGFKLGKSNPPIVDGYRILTNGKYKGDWSNGSANGNGEFILTDGTVLKGVFKNGKLNGKGRIIDINGQVLDCNFIDGVCNGKFKLVFPTGESLIGNFVGGKKNGVCKHIFKDGGSLSGNYVDDLPQGEFTIVTSDGSVFKSHYVHGKSVGELIPVDVKDNNSLNDIYSNIDAEKFKKLLEDLKKILEKYQLDMDNLLKNKKNESNKSLVEILTENINECKNNLSKLSDTDSVLKEILEKDIDNLEKSREKIDSFNGDESQKVIYHIYATNRVNWYFDLVKSVFKKHGVKLRDKSKYSYGEYYHNLQRLTKSFNNFIVKSHNAISYVNNIRNVIVKSDDPNIYDEVLLNVDKLYKDYYHQYKKFIDINDSLEIYFNDFWKFHTKM